MADLAATFRTFAEREALPTSPLYAALAHGVAGDDALLALADRARPGQPRPNMLFAAVHALLLAGQGSDLARHYASLADTPVPAAEAFGLFRHFCLEHEEAIAALLAGRSVGTNEVARCAVIRAGMAEVMAQSTGPLHVVEAGASAGLLLLWPRVAVDYGDGAPTGGDLALSCLSRGAPVPTAMAAERIGSSVGLDLDPMNLEAHEDRLWLDALIWPEHRERRARLRAAIDLARRAGIAVLRGDAIGDLPALLEGLPAGEAACVFHAFTFNQIPAPMADRFVVALCAASLVRPVFRLAYEWGEGDAPELTLTAVTRGAAMPSRRLANAEAHGRWIAWCAA